MLALLLAAGVLYLLLGEQRDAWTLVGFVVVVVSITIVQERRTERAGVALRQLSSPRALVMRSGKLGRGTRRAFHRARDEGPHPSFVATRNDPVRATDLLRSAFSLPAEIRAAASSLTSTPPVLMRANDCGVSRNPVGCTTAHCYTAPTLPSPHAPPRLGPDRCAARVGYGVVAREGHAIGCSTGSRSGFACFDLQLTGEFREA